MRKKSERLYVDNKSYMVSLRFLTIAQNVKVGGREKTNDNEENGMRTGSATSAKQEKQIIW